METEIKISNWIYAYCKNENLTIENNESWVQLTKFETIQLINFLKQLELEK